MLVILGKTELPHRNDLKISFTDTIEPSYKTPLDVYFENIAWNMCRGGLTTQSYIQDSTFYKTRQRLKFNYLRKNLHTRRLNGSLMCPTVILPTLILRL